MRAETKPDALDRSHAAAGRSATAGINRAAGWLVVHWLLVANLAMGLFIGGTLLPPVLMRLGWDGPARVVYALYGLNCHQLPQRSYFLFGPDGINTYSMEQVVSWGADPENPRRFVGNSQVGFKLGMAQRNTAIYGSFFLAGLGYGLVRGRARGRVRGLRWPAFLLLALPMVIDGGSHVVSEVTGLGFRASNGWLAALTGHAYQELFYTGTTLGSFNWLMRTVTGALFALACVGFAYPYLERAFGDIQAQTARQPAAVARAQQPEPTAQA